MITQDTLAIVTTLSSLDFNMTPHTVAKLAFPNNTHIQQQAKRYDRLLAFFGYLDLGNRAIFVKWLDRYMAEKTAA